MKSTIHVNRAYDIVRVQRPTYACRSSKYVATRISKGSAIHSRLVDGSEVPVLSHSLSRYMSTTQEF